MNRRVFTSSSHLPHHRCLAPLNAFQLLAAVLSLSAVLGTLWFFKGTTAQDSPAPVFVASAEQGAPRTAEQAREAYGRIELSFEANRGQTDPSVNFLARGAGYTIFLKPTEAVFVLAGHRGAAAQDSPKQTTAGQTRS